MSEYYFDFWQWKDLKWCIENRDWEGLEALVKSAEMRWYTLQMAQANQIVEFKYLK